MACEFAIPDIVLYAFDDQGVCFFVDGGELPFKSMILPEPTTTALVHNFTHRPVVVECGVAPEEMAAIVLEDGETPWTIEPGQPSTALIQNIMGGPVEGVRLCVSVAP